MRQIRPQMSMFLICCITAMCTVPSTSVLADDAVSSDQNSSSLPIDDGFGLPAVRPAGYHGIEYLLTGGSWHQFSYLYVDTRQAGGTDIELCANFRGDCQSLMAPASALSNNDRLYREGLALPETQREARWRDIKRTTGLPFNALIGPCFSTTQVDCIESVSIRLEDLPEIQGVFTAPFPLTGPSDFQSDIEARLPAGGTAGLWRFPGISHGGGSSFFIRVGLSGYIGCQAVFAYCVAGTSSFYAISDSGMGYLFGTKNLKAEIFAVEPVDSPCGDCTPRWRARDLQVGVEVSNAEVGECVMTGDGKCLRRRALPDSSEFTVTLRLMDPPHGWLHGRMTRPEYSIQEIDKSFKLPNGGKAGPYRVTIRGAATRVPVVAEGRNWNDLPTEVKSAYLAGAMSGPYTNVIGNPSAEPQIRNWIVRPPAAVWNTAPMNLRSGSREFEIWRDLIGDKSTADPLHWSAQTLRFEEIPYANALEQSGNNSCLRIDGTAKGVLATNAMIYSGGRPIFIDGQFEYAVSAPHLTSANKVRSGTFELRMRSEVARCFYKLNGKPVQVRVSISEDGGETSVALTTVSEAEGWLNINASNFQYSSKRMKIAITQAPTAMVRCMKDKTVRAVEAKRCPKGWKLKK